MSGNKLTSVILATLLMMSVFAGAFAGSAAAYSHGDEYDEVLNDGGLYWQGQTLEFDNGTVTDGDTLTLRKVTDSGDEFVGEYGADSAGNVTIGTADHTGEFYLENEAGDELARFEVAQQSMDVEVDNTTVYNQDDIPQNSAEFSVDSNRAGFDLVVNTTSLDIEELETVFANEDYEVRTDSDNNEYFVLNITSNTQAVEGNFSSLNTGEYTLNFIVEDTGVEHSTTIDVADPGDKNAQFNDSVYMEDQGDMFKFNVSLDNTQSAEVQLGNETYSGYSHNVSITNAKDDTVTLLFDTTEAGDGDATSPWSLHEDSDATITPGASETSIPAALAATSYDLSVSVDGLEKDVATLELQERNTEGVSIHTMPKASDYELSDIKENATSANEVAQGDLFVVEVHASGVYANLDNDTTGADLVNGSAFANANGFELALIDEDPGLNAPPKSYDISNAKDVVVDSEDNRFYVVFDTRDYTFDDVDEGHPLTAHFNMTQDNAYIEDEDEADAQSAIAHPVVVERDFTYDSLNDEDVLEATNSEESVISGTTTAAQGTEVTVNVRSTNAAPNPFTLSETVEVQADGTVEATFNMSAYEAGQNFTVAVRDVAPSRQDGTLVTAGPDDYEVSFTVENANGEPLEGASVSVDGEAYETGADGQVTAVLTENSTYTVEASADGYLASAQDVAVTENDTAFTLALEEEPTEYTTDVEVVDADGNAVADATVTVNGDTYTTDADGMASVTLTEGDYDFSVSAEGFESNSVSQTVDADGTVSVELTAEQTETPTTTPTETDNETNNTTPTDTDSSSDGQPGFGIAVALIALVGAALLAYRRD